MIQEGTISKSNSFSKVRFVSFVWQHVLLLFSLYVMTLGVALTIRSNLGSSVISSVPMAMTLAGEAGMAPALSVGGYTLVMNIVLVAIQIMILRRMFEKLQLFQLVIGAVFGVLLDINMAVTSFIPFGAHAMQIAAQLLGCVVLGYGIALEIRVGSVTMPGEGVPASISKLTGKPFAKCKIWVDVLLVLIAVALGYAYFGEWLTAVIGPGTLFAMIFVGLFVKFFDKHIGWFDRVLHYQPGFRRYIYGLKKYVKRL